MKLRTGRIAVTFAAGALACAALAGPFAGNATLVSRAANGDQGNAHSYEGSVSNNGKVVAWYSGANNIVPMDANGQSDIFVRDLRTGEVELVSRGGDGQPGSDRSYYPNVSANGRWVAYYTYAESIATGAVSGPQAMVYDRKTGETTEVSLGFMGQPADGAVDIYDTRPLSANGRWMVFHSSSTNLVPMDNNAEDDVFLADLRAGTLVRISNGFNAESDGPSRFASISPNGRWVVYCSQATNIVPMDGNAKWDVFLYDVKHGTTRLVSVASNGSASDGDSWESGSAAPSVNNAGTLVAFNSKATNLDPDSVDTNGFQDVYLRDLKAGTTKRISLGFMGAQPDGDAGDTGMDATGKTVTYWTYAGNMIDATDTMDYDQIVYDVKTGTSRRMLEALGGGQPGSPPSGGSYGYFNGFSANGRWFACASDADDVVEGDANGKFDVFVVDLKKKAPPVADPK